MPKKAIGRSRRPNLAFSLGLIFVSAAGVIFALTFLPWFEYLRPSPNENPYDLVALEKLPEGDREKRVEEWAAEFEALTEEEKAERADMYIESVVDFLDKKLDLGRGQRVETEGLIKSGALVATQSGLREEDFPDRDKAFQRLREQMRGELEKILSPEQRTKLQGIVEERERILRARRERFEARRRG
ncbi:MAG: hypothetical protein HUU16_02425 [Candidatus Omnitrophica bacterium]|nr:hypothetical protein [Candidatus Omnitrophota bacterium]